MYNVDPKEYQQKLQDQTDSVHQQLVDAQVSTNSREVVTIVNPNNNRIRHSMDPSDPSVSLCGNYRVGGTAIWRLIDAVGGMSAMFGESDVDIPDGDVITIIDEREYRDLHESCGNCVQQL